MVHPFRIVWMWADLPHEVPAQLAISVPKRRLKRAPDRNRIKRLVRESYRKHKSIHYQFLETNGRQLAVMLIYMGGKDLDYAECEAKIILTLQRLVKKCKHHSDRV